MCRLIALFALAVLAATPTLAQHDHHAAPDSVETYVVTGLRVDEHNPPPGSAVGRAGLRYGDGGYVSIVYGKPYRRGRLVVGGLVGYDAVWAAGAHRATELWTTVPLTIGGTRIAPGGYSLFLTPRLDRWTLHVNRRLGMHLADEYSAAEDLVTTDAVPVPLNERVEGLTWAFAPDGTGLVFSWDETGVTFPFRRAD